MLTTLTSWQFRMAHLEVLPAAPQLAAGRLDYTTLLTDTATTPLLAAGRLGLVLVYGASSLGGMEWVLKNPLHGQTWGVELPDVGRPYMVLCLNTERDLACDLHSLSHAVEWLACARDRPAAESLFGCYDLYHTHTSDTPVTAEEWGGAFSGIGTVHYPPYCGKAYDYEGAGGHEHYLRGWLAQVRARHPDWLTGLWGGGT